MNEPHDLAIIGSQLAETIFAHPALNETVLEAAEDAFGTATRTIRR